MKLDQLTIAATTVIVIALVFWLLHVWVGG
jgi:hypothetical protein